MGDILGFLIIVFACISSIWLGFFYLRKERFNNRFNFPDNGFEALIKITPLPPIFNFWIMKILFIIGSGLTVFLVIYGLLTLF